MWEAWRVPPSAACLKLQRKKGKAGADKKSASRPSWCIHTPLRLRHVSCHPLFLIFASLSASVESLIGVCKSTVVGWYIVNFTILIEISVYSKLSNTDSNISVCRGWQNEPHVALCWSEWGLQNLETIKTKQLGVKKWSLIMKVLQWATCSKQGRWNYWLKSMRHMCFTIVWSDLNSFGRITGSNRFGYCGISDWCSNVRSTDQIVAAQQSDCCSQWQRRW